MKKIFLWMFVFLTIFFGINNVFALEFNNWDCLDKKMKWIEELFKMKNITYNAKKSDNCYEVYNFKISFIEPTKSLNWWKLEPKSNDEWLSITWDLNEKNDIIIEKYNSFDNYTVEKAYNEWKFLKQKWWKSAKSLIENYNKKNFSEYNKLIKYNNLEDIVRYMSSYNIWDLRIIREYYTLIWKDLETYYMYNEMLSKEYPLYIAAFLNSSSKYKSIIYFDDWFIEKYLPKPKWFYLTNWAVEVKKQAELEKKIKKNWDFLIDRWQIKYIK